MERKVSFVEGEFYHLYNRGVDKRVIFASEANYRRFMMLLYIANSKEVVHVSNVLKTKTYSDIFSIERDDPLVEIGAFCLMPNHFHILATPLVEDGISKFMLKLQTAYSMYFNKLKTRQGSLFQGPFQSRHAGEDTYLKHLFSYIHLNPAKLKDPEWRDKSNSKLLQKFVSEYPYSSLHEYLSGKHVITGKSKYPDYFSTQKEILSHLSDWLNLGDVDGV